MRKKSILFVINNFNIGGPEKSLLSLLYRIDFKKYDVSFLSLNGKGTLTNYIPREVKIIESDPLVKYATMPSKNFLKETVKLVFSSKFYFPLKTVPRLINGKINRNMGKEKQKYWLRIKQYLPILQDEYDVAIGVSGGHSMMYIADCVKAKKRIGWIRADYRVLKRDHKIDALYFKKMDKILSVSETCKEIFEDIFPETTTKLNVMYNPLPFTMYKEIPADVNLMSRENNEVVLLTICRLDPYKGLDLAIEALEILLKKNINIKWYVLGTGNHKKKVELLIQEKGLEKNFILLGFQLNTANFIKEADIIVHPSRFEGKSNVVDEAKYLLKPIVATNYETVNEQIIHNKTGIISEMNSKSLAESVERVISMDTEIFRENLIRTRYDDTKSLEVFYKVIAD